LSGQAAAPPMVGGEGRRGSIYDSVSAAPDSSVEGSAFDFTALSGQAAAPPMVGGEGRRGSIYDSKSVTGSLQAVPAPTGSGLMAVEQIPSDGPAAPSSGQIVEPIGLENLSGDQRPDMDDHTSPKEWHKTPAPFSAAEMIHTAGEMRTGTHDTVGAAFTSEPPAAEASFTFRSDQPATELKADGKTSRTLNAKSRGAKAREAAAARKSARAQQSTSHSIATTFGTSTATVAQTAAARMAAAEAEMKAFQDHMVGGNAPSVSEETTVRARAKGFLGKARQAAVAAAERVDVTLASAHESALAKARAAATSASASVQTWRDPSIDTTFQQPQCIAGAPHIGGGGQGAVDVHAPAQPPDSLLDMGNAPPPQIDLLSSVAGASSALPTDLLSMKW
jgi:hypothetical protein